MNAAGKYALVITGALAVGSSLFVLSFAALDFVWTHFVVTDPQQIGLGDGVVVVGGGFLLGCTVGLAGLIFVLYRFWPGRAPKHPAQAEQNEAKS